MKLIINKFLLLGLFALFFSACSDDEHKGIVNDTVYRSYGIVEASGNGSTSVFNIKTDDGRKLYLENPAVGSVKNGDRVLVHYMLSEEGADMGSAGSNMYVKLINLEQLPVQDLLPQQYYYEKGDSLSVSGYITNGAIVNVEKIWIANDFINIEYKLVKRKDTEAKHFVNAVIYGVGTATNDKNERVSLIRIGICHGSDEAEGISKVPTADELDKFEYGPVRMISFSISDLRETYLPNSLISIHWDQYDDMKWIDGYICTNADNIEFARIEGVLEPELTMHSFYPEEKPEQGIVTN